MGHCYVNVHGGSSGDVSVILFSRFKIYEIKMAVLVGQILICGSFNLVGLR